MLDEEINTLLRNFEKDLFDFVNIVQNVEEEQNKGLSEDEEGSETHDTKRESKSTPENDVNVFNNNALSEAFKITRKILKRICNLLDQFPSLEETSPPNFDSLSVNYYYGQYIYQIVGNLVSMLEDNLNKFSEKLNQTSNVRPQKEFVSSSPSRSKKLPVVCMFKHLKPAALFTPDGRIFDPFSTFKDQLKLKIYPALRDRPEPELDYPFPHRHHDQTASDEEERKYETDFEDTTNVILRRLTESMKLLIPILENISVNLKEFARSQYLQPDSCSPSPPRSDTSEDTGIAGFGTKPKRTCCTEFCENCCRTCRRNHAASKLKSPRDYQKPFEDIIPSTKNDEPSWMRLNPVTKDPHKYKDCWIKDRICYRPKTCIPRRYIYRDKRGTDEHICRNSDSSNIQDLARSTNRRTSPQKRLYPPLCMRWVDRMSHFDETSPESESTKEFKLLGNLYKILRAEDKKIPACCRKKKPYCSGQLRSRTRFPEHKIVQKSPMSRNRTVKAGKRKLTFSKIRDSGSSSSDKESGIETRRNVVKILPSVNKRQGKHRHTEVLKKESSSESEPKPLFAKYLVDKVCNEKLLGEKAIGFYLLPSKQEIIDSKSDEDVPCHQPRCQTAVINFEEFSQLMKQWIREHTSGGAKSYDSQSYRDSAAGTEDSFEIPPDKGQGKHESPTKIDTGQDSDGKLDNTVDNLVDNVVHVAKKLAQVNREGRQGILTKDDRKILNKLQNVTVFSTGSRASHDSLGIMIENVTPKARQNFHVSEACSSCLKLIDPSVASATDFASRKYLKKLQGSQVMEDTCFRCWNGSQRALAIHVCHDKLPPGILEVRHMGKMGKINVCFLFWDMKVEVTDWRWLKNPFHDNTRVEIQQEATPEEDPLIMIVYGPEHTLVKESLGETRLRVIDDHPQDLLLSSQDSVTGYAKKQTSDTIVTFHVRSNRKKLDLRRDSGFKKVPFSREERNIACKLGSFFDAIQKNGYGRGPPLVIKLRRTSVISDAHDLLMVPSNVPLNYYRNLRVIFTSRDKSNILPTYSNFIQEDQSDELFDLFSRKIFGTEEYNLFTYASEESKLLYLNSESKWHPLWFTFAGIILGLAILHQKKMDIKLSACIFKGLLSRELNLEDLHEIDPTCHEKLMWIKKNDVDSRKGNITFVVKDTVGKGTIEHELVQGGRKISVTEKNKYRYIELVLIWKLAERYLLQLNDLRKGFHLVISPGFLTNFSHKELLSIIKNPSDPEIFFEERIRSSEFEPREVSRSDTW